MARTKKDPAADGAFADPANPTLHELNVYAQSLAAGVAFEAAGLVIKSNGDAEFSGVIAANIGTLGTTPATE